MQKSRIGTWILAASAWGLFALVSCQNATESTPSEALKVDATYTMGSLSRVPDSLTWSRPGDTTTHSQRPACVDTTCYDTFQLSAPLGGDSIQVQLWTLGVRTTTLYFGENGNSATLTAKPTFHRDKLDSLLLSQYFELGSAGKSAYAKFGSGSAGLVAYYAHLVQSGDPVVQGQALPVGMKQDSVDKDLVYWVRISKGSIGQLLALNLDSASIRRDVSALIGSGFLLPADSTSLFVPYPLRVKSLLSVGSDVVVGGGPVSVGGGFSWNKGRIVAPSLQVRGPHGPDSNFIFSISFPVSSSDTSWPLNNNLTIQAKSTATPGTDTLVVGLNSDSGYAISSQVVFQVVPGASAPVFSPAGGTFDLPQTVTVTANGADSIEISPDSTHWRLYVPPLLDSTSGKLFAKAFKGGVSGPVNVEGFTFRAPSVVDSTVSLSFATPGQDTSVPNATTTLALSVKTVSVLHVDSVLLNGQKLTKSSDTTRWSGTVSDLSVGPDTLKAIAYAGTKVSNTAVLKVTRAVAVVDSTVTLSYQVPGSDTSVANSSTSLSVKLKTVSALHVDSVRVGSQKLSQGSDTTIWTGTVTSLPVGVDTLKAIAYAGTKVSNTALLKVARPVDSTIAISFTGPGQDTAMGCGPLGVQVAVSSSLTIDSVVIGGQHLTRGAGSGPWSGTVSIAAGTNALHATAYAAGGKQTATATRTVTGLPAAPSFSAPTGTYADTLTLTLSDTTPGVTIYYTLDGSTPTNASSVYSAPLGLDADVAVKAVAIAGSASSAISSASYRIKHDTTLSFLTISGLNPAFSPGVTGYVATWASNVSAGAGSFAALDPKATVSCAGPCSTTGSLVNFTLGAPGTTTLVPVKVTNGPRSLTYNVSVQRRPDSAFFVQPEGNYPSSQAVTITQSSSAPLDSIQYSFDGSAWTTFHHTFYVNSTVTIYARTFRQGIASATDSATYTIDYGVPWNPKVAYGYLTDPRDEQVYKTVNLAGENWMAQNLAYASNGSNCYSSTLGDCPENGRLYPGNALFGICPSGWRIPTQVEWNNLFAAAGASSNGSSASIKAAGAWSGQAGVGTDDYGFRVLPSGYMDVTSQASGEGILAAFWSSSVSSDGVNATSDNITLHSLNIGITEPMSNSYSVRCISP